MVLSDPDVGATQCNTAWTLGSRGPLDQGLRAVWNGDGYRAARRAMADHLTTSDAIDGLCRPVCPRRQRGTMTESRLRLLQGREAFVRNQTLVFEDIRARRDEVRGTPLTVSVVSSTYCNYDCVMCDFGRTPRRDLPDVVWDEIMEMLPGMRELNLLGGEPLADPRVVRFLESDLDLDVRVNLTTNGSLLRGKLIDRVARAPLGDVTVSINAGDAATYERVERGVALDVVLGNVDALLAARAREGRSFSLALGFVVQPAASASIVAFGDLARVRGVGIRLLPLSPTTPGGLGDSFYESKDDVARVLADLGRFSSWASTMAPEWLDEIEATSRAIQLEAQGRSRHRLPLL